MPYMPPNETLPTKENIMFGTSYRYSINPVKNTITLTPTTSTYVKAFAPLVVLWAGILGMVAYAQVQERRMTATEYEDPED